ncbi:hypothetical protein, partial [Acidisoma sp. C75]
GEILARDLLPARLRSFGPAVNVMAFDYACRFGEIGFTARNVSIGPIEDIGFSLYDRASGVPEIELHANPALYDRARLATLRDGLARILE